ncbi:MAG: hypothetical protein S0880_18580, partial [Actinomycetota bacterium]|nr:hypothetical protein [Actinomycetota bacterium]
GGWCTVLLLRFTVLPSLGVADAIVAVPAVALPIGLGAHLAHVDRAQPARTRRVGLALALLAALAGGWFGLGAVGGLAAVATTTLGAAVGANLALVLADLVGEWRAGRSFVSAPMAEVRA